MKMMRVVTDNICPKHMEIELNDDRTIKLVHFEGGCKGNLQMISKMIQGKDALEIADLFEGNECGNKGTSCCNELSKSLRLCVQIMEGGIKVVKGDD